MNGEVQTGKDEESYFLFFESVSLIIRSYYCRIIFLSLMVVLRYLKNREVIALPNRE
ncbi:hypothetical protein [uncultured Methanobrevibacter sp.]|uniref:hypothetical protein n=1 Tax=uncultured Methanobrevibacter sp. TaxID=253161 RepID=UPI00261FB889|nr:hypothetical protein [uncultured Methanobrevibacter sp.]